MSERVWYECVRMCVCIHNHLYKCGTWLEREQVVFKRTCTEAEIRFYVVLLLWE